MDLSLKLNLMKKKSRARDAVTEPCHGTPGEVTPPAALLRTWAQSEQAVSSPRGQPPT